MNYFVYIKTVLSKIKKKSHDIQNGQAREDREPTYYSRRKYVAFASVMSENNFPLRETL